MPEGRIYVDFSEMIAEDLVPLSNTDEVINSKGKGITLKAGLNVKVYSDDLSSCGEADNLIAEGRVELNNVGGAGSDYKWNCRISKAGICNESQKNSE